MIDRAEEFPVHRRNSGSSTDKILIARKTSLKKPYFYAQIKKRKMKNRMKSLFLGLCFGLLSVAAFSQTTAMDFNRMDCNGNMQHLFADLDAGNAVILEFFMQNCTPCITAGNKLEPMKADLLAEFPGKIKSYAIGFNNSYTCQSNANWVANNGFTSIPMDSGAAQVAYYGGMGMPTIVILGGGTNHSVLGVPYIGFTTSDTTTMAMDIRNFLSTTTSVADLKDAANGISIYPNPSNGLVTFKYAVKDAGDLSLQVLDLSGRVVRQISDEHVGAGEFVKTWSSADIAAGSYLIKMNLEGVVSTQRFTVTH